MYRPRIIPTLLLKGSGLVKSKGFTDYVYIGDPINAVRIFNEMKADELVFLDITASHEGRSIAVDFVKDIAEEANMPFSVGGGVRSLETIRSLIANGAEKVILNTVARADQAFVKAAVAEFGSSSIAACIDVKSTWMKGRKVYDHVRKKQTALDPVELACALEKLGVGEIIIQSVDRDGAMNGYDIELVSQVSKALTIPVVALGGAGDLSDLSALVKHTTVNGLAAGSLFVFNDRNRAVLINYPRLKDL